MRVLVTGATGFIGSHLVERLSSEHEVVAAVRDVDRARSQLGSKVQLHRWVPLDAGQRDTYRAPTPPPPEALEHVDAVIHLAGENIGKGRWTASRKEALRRSRIETAQALIGQLPDSCRTFISASAIAAYPGRQGERYTEDTALDPPPPDDFLHRLVHDWEAVARTAEARGCRVAMLRTGLVLGEEGLLSALVPSFKLGAGSVVGSGEQHVPWIHVDDVARMYQWALEDPAALGPINAVGPAPISYKAFAQALGRALGRPAWLKVPEAAVKLAMGEQAALALESYDVHPVRAIEHGFTFTYDTVDEALDAVLNAPRRQAA